MNVGFPTEFYLRIFTFYESESQIFRSCFIAEFYSNKLKTMHHQSLILRCLDKIYQKIWRPAASCSLVHFHYFRNVSKFLPPFQFMANVYIWETTYSFVVQTDAKSLFHSSAFFLFSIMKPQSLTA